MIELRHYQQAAKDAVYRHLRMRDDNPVIVIPTGGGKTPLIASICQDAVQQWGGRVLVMAHVKELLQQAADKLGKMCPGIDVGLYSAGLSRKELDKPVTVAGVQSIYRHACELGKIDLILVDECFVTGTPVSTPHGTKPIELIRPGDTVLNACGVGKVIAISARPATHLVELELSDGTSIRCTRNHKLFTSTGWVEAGSVGVGEITYSVEAVRALRNGISPVDKGDFWAKKGDAGKELGSPELLLNILRQEADERFMPTGSQGEDSADCNQKREPAKSEGREWSPVEQVSGGPLVVTRKGVDCRACHSNKEAKGYRIPDVLQGGYGEPDTETCNRSGRCQSSHGRAETAGREEAEASCGTRVVRVSHIECDGFEAVHNLHVDNHPSYFAGGILAHNCHLIPPDGDGMYRSFLRECQVVNPRVRVVGLTATPFRTGTGPVCSDDHFLNAICYEVSVRQLISEGFLSPIVAKAGQGVSIDFAAIAKRAGEFDATASEQAFDKDEITSAAVGEILAMTADRRSVLIFATGVKHAEHIRKAIEASGQECGIVTGSTPSGDRAEMLARFKGEKLGMLSRPPLKFLVNVNVLTTGFDAPNVDCVVLLRPTMSAGLYYQMVGRGFRLFPGKSDCLVLDYGDNARRHGPVDKLQIKSPGSRGGSGEAPGKECPTCHSVIFSGYSVCPDCGHEFPQTDSDKLGHTSAGVPVLSGVVEDEEHEVESVEYAVHRKRGAADDAPKTLRVIYRFNPWDSISEWICIEHTGWAQQQAKKWWAGRSAHEFPYDTDYAVKLANAGALAHPVKVFTRKISGEQWPKILRVECGEIPPKSLTVPDLETEEVPF